jgi:hypothetical protein
MPPDAVFDALADVDPEQLRTLASLLRLAGGSPSLFATPIDCHADVHDDPSLSGGLGALALRRALRVAALDESFVARLEDAEEPFWIAVYEAMR